MHWLNANSLIDTIWLHLKGIVHPNMSLFTHPQVVSNMYGMDLFVLLNTKEDILKNVGNRVGQGQGQGQGYFICHILNYTGYN